MPQISLLRITQLADKYTLRYVRVVHQNALDPVYMVPNPCGQDIKLNGLKTSIAFKFMIILQNLIATPHRKSGKSKCYRKLTELDVMTMRIQCSINGF